jgi:hypothetical protein
MTENHKNTPQSEGESPQDTININDNTKVNNLNYYVSLFPECREDLKMWHIFLKQWNCVSFFYDTLTTSSDGSNALDHLDHAAQDVFFHSL